MLRYPFFTQKNRSDPQARPIFLLINDVAALYA